MTRHALAFLMALAVTSAPALVRSRVPQWRFSDDGTAELQALIEAMEEM
ncbi:hypothetical protein [Streptomyces sp. NPDC016172]